MGIWPKRKKGLFFSSLLLITMLFLFGFFIQTGILSEAVPVTGSGQKFFKKNISDNFLKSVLNQGLPLMHVGNVQKTITAGEIVKSVMYNLTEVNVEDPKTFINSELSYIKGLELNDDQEAVKEQPVLKSDRQYLEEDNTNLYEEGFKDDKQGQDLHFNDEENSNKSGEDEPSIAETQLAEDNPLVAIYNTHNAETYMPTDGVKRKEGKNGGVVKVAGVLEDCLKGYGVRVVRSSKIHDYPDWDLSYSNSKETVKEMLAKNPSIQIVIDIHRDAGLKEKKVVTVNGKKAAQILIIVGSNERLPHPNWKKNKEFAEIVCSKMEELYPGLCRGVRVQSGRYNQHLHPHAILAEVGNVKNTLEEAEYSAKLLAHVISEVLKDLKKKTL